MSRIKPIRTKTDYKNVMKRIDAIILKNPKKGTAIYDEPDVLGTLVAAYEEIHFKL